MSVHAADEIVGNADIDRSSGTASEDINKELFHSPSFRNRHALHKAGHDGTLLRHHRAALKARDPVIPIR